ncbi:MAG: polysulfide reductase NrfD [Desulfamplus sp.]|nr:polysulfide reductase NrfD [Desulfamplus sp.]
METKKNFYNIWLALLGVLILGGLYTTFKIIMEGHGILGGNDMLVWTMPIATYVFLALMSSGFVQLSSFPAVFDLGKYKHLARRFSYMALATLLAAFLALSLELGSLFKMVYFIFSPNLSSPMWWMSAIYLAELVFIMSKLISSRKSKQTPKPLSIISSGVSVLAPLMLGAIFSMIETRPVFFGLFIPVFFLALAFLSATAMVILWNFILDFLETGKNTTAATNIVELFSKGFEFALGISILLYAMRFVFKATTNLDAFTASITLFPILMLVISFILIKLPASNSNKNYPPSALLALIGIVGCHMELLYDGQARTVGVLKGIMPEVAPYWSNPWEWLIFLFAIGVMFALYTLGEKVFQLNET